MVTGTNQKLETIHKEYLPVARAATLLLLYLRLILIIIHTDYEAFGWLLTSAIALGKLARRWIRLPEFNIKVLWRAISRHQVPYALSRLKMEGTDESNFNGKLLVHMTDEVEEQQGVEREYFRKDQPGRR